MKQNPPIIGEVVHHWTVLAVDEPKGSKVRVSVICVCGKTAVRYLAALRHRKNASCGCRRPPQKRGSESTNWKGGRRVEDGYVLVYKPFHPHAKSNGYVREHTFVMCNILGRRLLPNEEVHHKNGDRADNRIENLELWSTSQPPGQRVEDKLKWAYEIIALYGG